mmetsp:Transcript_5903/g.6787  ORF Transcript_5903/g.6787 Transcript_5903/m.6787 type:complete len:238 (+) Transcript_5903:198-911(+)
MGPLVTGFLVCVIPGLALLYVAKNGHSRLITDLFVFIIVSILCIGFALLEIVNLMIWPFRFCRRILGFGPKRLSAQEASEAATGRRTTDQRRIVIFDGVCVLCNNFGKFAVSHLPDPNMVSFLPYQDQASNPHLNINRLKEEFKFQEEMLQDRIAVIDGDTIKWGADAIITILTWCYFPFPVAKLGLLVPHPIRDACYLTVAKNRYRWFGTQPLEKNFAKYLCPYIFVKDKVTKKTN